MAKAKKITLKSAQKTSTACENVRAAGCAWIFWLLLGVFAAAIILTLAKFSQPTPNAKNDATAIAAQVQPAVQTTQPATEPVATALAEPEIIMPQIDDRVAVVANAVVLTDEQKEQQAQDYILAGVENLTAGKPDLALADFNSAIALFPTFAPAYVYRGEALFDKTDYSGALDSFETAIELDKNNAMAYFDKAVLQIKIGDTASALVNINAAVNAWNAAPESNQNMSLDEIYRQRAELHLWNKNWLESVRDYTMSSSLAKNAGRNDFADMYGRAEAKMGLGDFAGAIADFDTAIRSIAAIINDMPNQENKAAAATMALGAFEKRAAIRLRTGDLDGAKEDLRGAIVLATAIGDGDRKEALESSLNQL